MGIPPPKPFKGRWKNEKGKMVCIDGDKMLHEDGKQETITDLENQVLYTHRVSVRKGWLKNTPVVKGASGKVEEDVITWHDGRVWVKAREDDGIGKVGSDKLEE